MQIIQLQKRFINRTEVRHFAGGQRTTAVMHSMRIRLGIISVNIINCIAGRKFHDTHMLAGIRTEKYNIPASWSISGTFQMTGTSGINQSVLHICSICRFRNNTGRNSCLICTPRYKNCAPGPRRILMECMTAVVLCPLAIYGDL